MLKQFSARITAALLVCFLGGLIGLNGCGNGTTSGSGGSGSTGSVKIATASLAAGTVGVAYNATIVASGGSQSYTFSVITGAPPRGLP